MEHALLDSPRPCLSDLCRYFVVAITIFPRSEYEDKKMTQGIEEVRKIVHPTHTQCERFQKNQSVGEVMHVFIYSPLYPPIHTPAIATLGSLSYRYHHASCRPSFKPINCAYKLLKHWAKSVKVCMMTQEVHGILGKLGCHIFIWKSSYVFCIFGFLYQQQWWTLVYWALKYSLYILQEALWRYSHVLVWKSHGRDGSASHVPSKQWLESEKCTTFDRKLKTGI